MRYPRPSDTELMTAINRFVNPGNGPDRRYLTLLHGNLLALNTAERKSFGASLAEAAQLITDHELSILLDSEWRSRLTAAWLIGLDRRVQFRQRLASLFMASELCFTGQGYSFALTRFGEHQDADILLEYLQHYLPRLDCHYDQHWAIGALMNLDEQHSVDRTRQLTAPGGLWDNSAMSRLDPVHWKARIADLCAFAEACMRFRTAEQP